MLTPSIEHVAAVDPSVFVALVAAILGGGIWQAIVAFRKAPKESEQLTVSTMREVIEEVRAEKNELRQEVARLREENRHLHDTCHRLEAALQKAEVQLGGAEA